MTEKLVYRSNAGTDLGKPIAKENPIILVKWLDINLMDTVHTWIILGLLYILAGSMFIVYVAMRHCCGLLVLA